MVQRPEPPTDIPIFQASGKTVVVAAEDVAVPAVLRLADSVVPANAGVTLLVQAALLVARMLLLLRAVQPVAAAMRAEDGEATPIPITCRQAFPQRQASFPMPALQMWDRASQADCPFRSGPPLSRKSGLMTTAKTIRMRTAFRWVSCNSTRIPNPERSSRHPMS